VVDVLGLFSLEETRQIVHGNEWEPVLDVHRELSTTSGRRESQWIRSSMPAWWSSSRNAASVESPV
jgi:hypothetical protein